MLIILYPRNSKPLIFSFFYYDISAILTCLFQMTLKYQTLYDKLHNPPPCLPQSELTKVKFIFPQESNR